MLVGAGLGLSTALAGEVDADEALRGFAPWRERMHAALEAPRFEIPEGAPDACPLPIARVAPAGPWRPAPRALVVSRGPGDGRYSFDLCARTWLARGPDGVVSWDSRAEGFGIVTHHGQYGTAAMRRDVFVAWDDAGRLDGVYVEGDFRGETWFCGPWDDEGCARMMRKAEASLARGRWKPTESFRMLLDPRYDESGALVEVEHTTWRRCTHVWEGATRTPNPSPDGHAAREVRVGADPDELLAVDLQLWDRCP